MQTTSWMRRASTVWAVAIGATLVLAGPAGAADKKP
jgi:hypothetical protein